MVACKNTECLNYAAPFQSDGAADLPACPVCGDPLQPITDAEIAAIAAARPVCDPEPTLPDPMIALREQRDTLLAGCDWTQLPDSPLADATRAAWATYRQQLRNYPDQPGFDPLNPPAWPTPPA